MRDGYCGLPEPTDSKPARHLRSECKTEPWKVTSHAAKPISEPDKLTGHRLHQADAATNKILAAAGRDAPRDYVDCLFLHQAYCSLGALAWAAAAKDPGLPPEFILEQLRRTKYTLEELANEVDWVIPYEPQRMKEQWVSACDEAEALFDWLPRNDMGCLYLNRDLRPVTPKPDTIKSLRRHHACVKGAWPKIGIEKPNPGD